MLRTHCYETTLPEPPLSPPNLSSMPLRLGSLRGRSSWAQAACGHMHACECFLPTHGPSPTPDRTKTLLLQVCSSYQSCKTRWPGQRGKHAKRSSILLAESCQEGSLGACTSLCTTACIHNASVICPLSLSSPSPSKAHSGIFLPEGNRRKRALGLWGHRSAPGEGPGRAEPAGIHPSPWSHRKPHESWCSEDELLTPPHHLCYTHSSSFPANSNSSSHLTH